MKFRISYFLYAMMTLQFQAAAGINYSRPICEKELLNPLYYNYYDKVPDRNRDVFVNSLDTPEGMSDDIDPKDWDETLPAEKERKTQGYIGIVEVNYGVGIGTIELFNYPDYENKKVNSFGFKWVNGYRCDEHLTVGLGLGIDAYSTIRDPMLTFFMPVSLDSRFVIVNSDLSPVINLNAGYSIGLSGLNGGILINPSFGFIAYTNINTALLFNVGYKWQGMLLPIPDSNAYGGPINPLSQNVTLKFITFNIGFSF